MVILIGFGFSSEGLAGAAVVLLVLGVHLLISVVLGIVACFITAAVLKTSFGEVGTAAVKLAAIMSFPLPVAMVIPILGWLVALVLYFALLMILFDLELFDVIVFAIVLSGVRWIA